MRHQQSRPTTTTSTTTCSLSSWKKKSFASELSTQTKSGKVLLAAIVHHDCCWVKPTDNIDHALKRSKPRNGRAVKSGEHQLDLGTNNNYNNNTHDIRSRPREGLSKRLANRLLFSSKKQHATKLIDSRQINEYQQPDRTLDKKCIKRSSREEDSKEQPIKMPPSELQVREETNICQQNKKKLNRSASSEHSGANVNSDRKQVIEFKFDLIVDRDDLMNENHDDEICSNSNNKLDHNVLSMIHSFVSESSDVCLMSMGREQPTESSPRGYHSSIHCNKFHYLFHLALVSIRQTLEYRQDQEEANKSANRDLELYERVNCLDYSLELSSTLFVSESAPEVEDEETCGRLFSIIDLLVPSSEQSSSSIDELQDLLSDSNGGIKQQTSIECSDLAEARLTIERLKDRVNYLTRREKSESDCRLLLMICLKLKRRINGGLFSNRMCLIDFDPSFLELQPILESTFSGHALNYLKQHKIRLQSLETSLLESMNLIRGSDHEMSSVSELSVAKKHHQVASENKLIQAEWLLYKQLSSALIKTLIVVHVQKLSSDQANLGYVMSELEHKTMANNLQSLELARSIQRASAVRLKRREQRLKHHLASSDASVASNVSETTTTNEFLSSPVRFRQASSTLFAERKNRKCSMDTSLALARHFRRHRNGTTTNSRAAIEQLLKKSDLIESSSISTSSGSGARIQTTDRTESSRGVRNQNTSDTDSITSANLNSCSSYSVEQAQSYCMKGKRSYSNKSNAINRDADLFWLKRLASGASNKNDRSSFESSTSLSSSVREPNGNSAQLIASSPRETQTVIEIDCDPKKTRNRNLSQDHLRESNFEFHRKEIQMSDNLKLNQNDKTTSSGNRDDDRSETSSIIAEPPKQLKLEEFLSQLNNVIAPIRQNNNLPVEKETISKVFEQFQEKADSVSTVAVKVDHPDPVDKDKPSESRENRSKSSDNQLEINDTDDDDEDCKSHSSILEHLSSLARGSNCRSNYGLGRDRQEQQIDGLMEPNEPTHLDLFSLTRQQDHEPRTGHKMGYLQQLLNGSNQTRRAMATNSRVELKESSTLEDRLSELTIKCHSPSVSSSGAFTSSNVSNSSTCISPNESQGSSKNTTTSKDLPISSITNPKGLDGNRPIVNAIRN